MGTDEKIIWFSRKCKYSAINDNLSFNYKFSISQNYNELNYNEIGTNLELGLFNFDISYLEKSTLGIKIILLQSWLQQQQSNISFETKRDLVKDSAEFII